MHHLVVDAVLACLLVCLPNSRHQHFPLHQYRISWLYDLLINHTLLEFSHCFCTDKKHANLQRMLSDHGKVGSESASVYAALGFTACIWRF